MKKLALSALAATALIGVGGACTPVSAQAPAANDTARPAQSERMRGHLPGERIDARLAYIKTALKITPQQEPQWNAFAEVLRKHTTAMDQQIQQRRATGDQSRANRNALDRLQDQQKFMADGAARMNEVITAARPLYASFNDEQKKVADEMLNRRGGFGGGGHHGRWH